jgi:hypothetical protein
MIRRWPAALTRDRSLQALPFVVAAVLLGAMQARLLPVRPIQFDIPSTSGIPPGAAPKESMAPPAPVVAPAPVLPSESVPSETSPSASDVSSAIAPGARRTTPVTDAWTDHLPRQLAPAGGAGNINTRSRQPNAITVLVTSLMRSLKRIHPIMLTRTKAMAAKTLKLGTEQNRIKVGPPAIANAPKSSLAGWALGGAAPRRPGLGGATSQAAKYAPIISGLSVGSYR